MRTMFLMMTTMILSACAVETTTDTAEEEVGAVAQATEGPVPTHLEAWRDIAALEQSNPDLFQHSVDLLVDAGVTCFEEDHTTGSCLDIDEGQATQMLKEDPAVDCKSTCVPWSQIPWDGIRCRHRCCVDIFFEICHAWEVGDDDF